MDGSGVTMVTRLALHSGSLNLDTKSSGKNKNKIQIELQATELASVTSCWRHIHNDDLLEGRYMKGGLGGCSGCKLLAT